MSKASPTIARISAPPHRGAFPRERLYRLLDEKGKTHPVLWITGPPGAGKTTLAAGYLRSRDVRHLWYRSGPDDADPSTLFRYLRLAAGTRFPEGAAKLPAFAPGHRRRLGAYARQYFECLYEFSQPFVLVLDNLQDVPADAPFHRVIREGLSLVPDGVRVFLVSRDRPPASLARMQVHRILDVVDWEALRLTPAEAAEIVRGRVPGELGSEPVQGLLERSDGWAAGLVLMLEAWAQGTPHAGGKARDAVFDYFDKELFEKAAPDLRRFAAKTSILAEVTPDAAARLTGSRDAGRLLEEMHRSHFFLDRRTEGGVAYRYHPLFRSFLRNRAGTLLDAAESAALCGKAAGLLERAGRVVEAATLLREADDIEGLGRLLGRCAPSLLRKERHAVLEALLEAVPERHLSGSPWLSYWAGVVRTPRDPARGRSLFERSFELFGRTGEAEGLYSAWSGVVGCLLLEGAGAASIDRWLAVFEELRKTRGEVPAGETEARVAAGLLQALCARRPEDPRIGEWSERGLAIARKDIAPEVRVRILCTLFRRRLGRGDVPGAELLLDLLRAALRAGAAPPFARILVRLAEARFAAFTHRPAACRKAVTEGLAVSRESGARALDGVLLAEGACGALNAGDLPEARSCLRAAARVLDRLRPHEACGYHAQAARLGILEGDIPKASLHAGLASGLATRLGFPEWILSSRIQVGQVLCLSGKLERADEAFRKGLRLARRTRLRGYEALAGLGLAMVALERGEEAVFRKTLAAALGLGKSGGCRPGNLWPADAMIRLYVAALEAGIETEHVREAVTRCGWAGKATPMHAEEWPWAVKVYTLGRFALVAGGAPVRFAGKVQQQPLRLLKALIAMGGREVAQERIIDALWPEAEGDGGHRAFATTLHRLRGLLGEEKAIRLREGRVTLDNRYCWVDAWAFQRLLGMADAAARGSAQGRFGRLLPDPLGKAARLYQGAFLPEEGAAPWSVPLRERLRSRHIRCVEALGRRFEQAGLWEEAIDTYRRGLEADPLAEETCRRLMRACQRQERPEEGRSAFERLRKSLASTLGAEPAPATRSLWQALGGSLRSVTDP